MHALMVFAAIEILASLLVAAALLFIAYSDPASSSGPKTTADTKDIGMETPMASLTCAQLEQAWRVAQTARECRIQAEHDLERLRRREQEALENAKSIAACAADDAVQALQEELVSMED